MRELLAATEKYSDIHIIENSNADIQKAKVRDAIQDSAPMHELFFYFMGSRISNTKVTSTYVLLTLTDADRMLQVFPQMSCMLCLDWPKLTWW